jgi:electron transfer flavoprotein beta subunit
MITHKLAATPLEYAALLKRWPEFETAEALDQYLGEHDLKITVWSGADVGADYNRVGLSGSPTKVLKVNYVVLEGADSREFEASQAGVSALVQELVQDYIL